MSKIITYQDGMLHILRNPHGFKEETIREARLAAADEIERLTRERDEAMNANMAKIAPYLPPLTSGAVAADTPAPMTYREVVSYAERLVESLNAACAIGMSTIVVRCGAYADLSPYLKAQYDKLRDLHRLCDDAALAKNPNGGNAGLHTLAAAHEQRDAEYPTNPSPAQRTASGLIKTSGAGDKCPDSIVCCWPWECAREGACQRSDIQDGLRVKSEGRE